MGDNIVMGDNGKTTFPWRRPLLTANATRVRRPASTRPFGIRYRIFFLDTTKWSSCCWTKKKNRKFQPFLAPYHRAFPYSKNSTVLRKKRFLAFVEDLLLENKILGSHYVYLHFYPMSRILRVLRKYNTNLTGYINGLESLTSTWPDFMVSTCGGELGFPSRERLPVEMKVAGQHDSSNDPLGLYQAAKDVWAEQGPIARALCLLYAFDYACFPKLPIPALCRSVYRDHSNTIVEKANRTMVSKTGRHYGA